MPPLEIVASAAGDGAASIGFRARGPERRERRYHVPLNNLEETPEEVLEIAQTLFYGRLRRSLGLPPRPQPPKAPPPFLSPPGTGASRQRSGSVPA